MKLEVWNDAVELQGLVNQITNRIDRIDFKLKSQLLDSTQSISANISEGYCRRTINEYLQHLNVALGSSGESITRMIGIRKMGMLPASDFEEFDKLHFEMENKLLALIKSLQEKRRPGGWEEELRDPEIEYSA